MYKKNDYVVYRHDVCVIKNIKENKINGKVYYVMSPIDDETLTIDIPLQNENVFLRNIISKDEAETIIKNIKLIKPLDNINDRNIEIQYKYLINTFKHEDLIKIIKTTYLRNTMRSNNKKKISEKDTNYFELAEKYLYNELSIALNKSVQEVKEYIYEEVNK